MTFELSGNVLDTLISPIQRSFSATIFDESKMKLKLDWHKKIEAKNLAKIPQFRFLNLVLPNIQEKTDIQLLTH